MLVSWLVDDHLEKLGKKTDKHKQDIRKWKNGVGDRIELKFVNIDKKIGVLKLSSSVAYY